MYGTRSSYGLAGCLSWSAECSTSHQLACISVDRKLAGKEVFSGASLMEPSTTGKFSVFSSFFL